MSYQERILVVDDDPALLEQAEEILSDHYEISLASSGRQALQALQRGLQPDLILLDILMPEMDGYAALEEIRTLDGCKEVPVIYLTSLTDPASEIQGLAVGAADYMTKPFNAQVLKARVELRLHTGPQLDPALLEQLPESLTDVEMKVAKLLAKSCSNDEIAVELHYALDTVKKIVSRILEKLQIKSRKEIKKYLK